METAAGMGTHYLAIRRESRSAGSSTATTPSTPRFASATDARQPRGSRASGTHHTAWPPPGGHRVPDRWGSLSVCRSAVNRRHGSAGQVSGGPSVPDRREPDRSPAGGEPPVRICWSLLDGHACLIAGSLIDRRPAVNRRRGSAGRSWAGTGCLIAGSSTVCRPAGIRLAGSVVATRRAQGA
jgi:hypothetical protein